ncbi:nucleolar protein 9-like [Saccostrea echinata]|uniref:nucleolar protein 9-like n=1 Tax=Saccostrea echinata TaxID=191078 RepID=UPI002A826FDE|nr:nucleolar protein 9-like [Saccostrea echinata]
MSKTSQGKGSRCFILYVNMGKKDKKKGNPKSHSRQINRKVDDETVNYYSRIAATLDEGFEGQEEQELFLHNVFIQLEKEDIHVFMHPSLQEVLVKLTELSSIEQATKLLQILKENTEELLNDGKSRKVMCSLLLQVAEFVEKDIDSQRSEENDDHMEELKDVFLEICQSLKGDVENVLVVKTVLQILGGHVNISAKELGVKRTKTAWSYTPPIEFIQTFHEMCDTIFSLEDIEKKVEHNKASMVLTHIFPLLHKVDQAACHKFIRKYLTMSSVLQDYEKFLWLVSDSRGSFLMQTVIECSSDEIYTELYTSVCKGHLLNLAIHPQANFVLESLIARAVDKDQFEDIFMELKENFEDVLAFNHLRIISSLAKASLKLKTCQMKLVKHLMRAFHCFEPEDRQGLFVPLLATLTTYEVYFGIEEGSDKPTKENPTLGKVNIHGSLILQTLLEFKNPKYVVNSFLQMTPENLRNMACDSSGSRVMEVFFKSCTVTEKNKAAMVDQLQDVLQDIACSSCGSWIIETMWKELPLQKKTDIVKILAKHERRLSNDQYGRYIHKNCGVSTYIHNVKNWKEMQTSSQKKRKMFQEILEAPDIKKKKKKKA